MPPWSYDSKKWLNYLKMENKNLQEIITINHLEVYF